MALKRVADRHLGPRSALFARQRRQRVRDMRQHVEEIAFLGVDDLLHLGQLLCAKALFREPCKSFFRVSGALHSARSSASSLKNSGSLPNSSFHELLRRHGRAVRMPERGAHHVLDGALFAVREFHFRLLLAHARTLPASLARLFRTLARTLPAHRAWLRRDLLALTGIRPALRASGSIGSPSHSGSLK